MTLHKKIRTIVTLKINFLYNINFFILYVFHGYICSKNYKFLNIEDFVGKKFRTIQYLI